jgi:ORF6N domain
MLDSDLAGLYGVLTKRLNEAVRRNAQRFPDDFMFQLTREETQRLRSQFATLEKSARGRYRKYWPMVFTEHGVAMLSSYSSFLSSSCFSAASCPRRMSCACFAETAIASINVRRRSRLS